MKIKQNLWMAGVVTAMAFGGSGIVWGQHNLPGSHTSGSHPDGTNVFSAADSRTLSPQTQGGTWITLGGENCILHASTVALNWSQDGYNYSGGSVSGTNCNPSWSAGVYGTMYWSIPTAPNTNPETTNPYGGVVYSHTIAASDYTTPTTVILTAGNHQYTQFLFNKITWGGVQYSGIGSANGTSPAGTHPGVSASCTYTYTCGTSTCTGSESGTGYPTLYYRQFTYSTTYPGGFELDGAIKLVGGARIQLTGNIDKGTGAAAPTKKHVIVFPNSGGYTLRMNGNFGDVQVNQEATTSSFYTASNIPGNIAGTGPILVRNSDTLGVNGDYNNTDTRFHTSGTGGAIQIGENTNNTDHFYIFSGGTLMNYGNNNVHIGNTTKLPVMEIDAGTSACRNYPTLITSITDGSPLRILNTSSSSIIFENTTTPAPNLTFTGGGPLWIQAMGGSVTFDQGATFTVNTTNNYIQVQAAQNITTNTKPFIYNGGTNNYNFIAGNNVTFSAQSPVNITTRNACADMIRAGQNITANASVYVDKLNTSSNTMWANSGNFTVADGQPYTFLQEAASGDVMVYAGVNITMGGTVVVTRTLATPAGKINWRANTGDITAKQKVTFTNSGASDSTNWYAGSDIFTKDTVIFNHKGAGATTWTAKNGQIETDNTAHGVYNDSTGVRFTHEGTGNIEWYAGTNIHTKNIVNFLHKTAAAGGKTRWVAEQNIWTDRYVKFVNENATDSTLWWAKAGSIVTSHDATGVGNVDFLNLNASAANAHTVWRAGLSIITNEKINFYNNTLSDTRWIADAQNIETKDTVIFDITNANSTASTTWWAGQDILTSSNIAAHSDSNGVRFTQNGKGLIQWYAGRDIHAQNHINFLHTSASTYNAANKTRWWAERDILTDDTVNFINLGVTDSIFWHAGQDIITGHDGHTGYIGRVNFQNLNTASVNAHTKWEAGRDIITNAHVNFNNLTPESNTTWDAGRDILVNDSTTFYNDQEGNTIWQAGNDIITSDTVVMTNNGSGYTKWWAGRNIETWRTGHGNPSATENGYVTFNNTQNSTGIVEWEAGSNIFTNNVVTFNDTTQGDGYIKWWAKAGDIRMNDSTVFNRAANNDIGYAKSGSYTGLRSIPHNISQGKEGSATIVNPAAIPVGSLWLVAGQNILSENSAIPTNPNNEEPLLITFGQQNNAPIMIHAEQGSIILDGVTHIDRLNPDTSEVTFEAGTDIHFLDTFTLSTVSTDVTDILLHAHRDIRTNDSTCSNTKTAPVTFTVADNTLTRWIADRNLHTTDTMKFNYDATNEAVKDLHFVAQGGNLTTDRWFNIAFDGNSNILFSAESNATTHQYNYNVAVQDGPTAGKVYNTGTNHRDTLNGNIFFNDSMILVRSNSLSGKTELLAKNNIRTAMVNYTDKQSQGDSVRIESYMGDIFLGYSTQLDGCQNPPQNMILSYDSNRFVYYTNPGNTAGRLDIKAGYEDMTPTDNRSGGNIYFSHIDATMGKGGTHPTEISIPYSYEYVCGRAGDTLHSRLNHAPAMQQYEHAGIIGGVGRCGEDLNWSSYAPSLGLGTSSQWAHDTTLIYRANNGELKLDAGTRGNIIINRGTYLNFQKNAANAFFLTRNGDIDMRTKTDIDSLQKSVLFLASSELPNKLKTGICGCDEEKNNVYLQDFKYIFGQNAADQTKGSIFIGADNNIKLQYGGLKNRATRYDPFISENRGYVGTGFGACGTKYHCDSDTSENQARNLILNFALQNGDGGFGAVASDMIDVYKKLIYNGGTSGTGMSAVPNYGTLHGESVEGWGLYFKTQANKNNWTKINSEHNSSCPEGCKEENCTDDFQHSIARITFHDDARIYAENQKVYIGSPVLESYGVLQLNTDLNKGSKTSIQLQMDSLILHDSLIIDGLKTKLSTWNPMPRDVPVLKLGHQRFTPPYSEDPGVCEPCHEHDYKYQTYKRPTPTSPLDTMFITFRNEVTFPRLHSLVLDHTVLTFLTDSFDHVLLGQTRNAQLFSDTTRVRNQVELWASDDHTHDGHFELISEDQMASKQYAGIYTKHLHLEPVGACGRPYSELWLQDPSLEVITTSTFGGFGQIYADVYVEVQAKVAPGYASLGLYGRCYEQIAGTLYTKDIRLDDGAELHFTVGTPNATDGQAADLLDVDKFIARGKVKVFVEKRPCQEIDTMCYPILRYKSTEPGMLNLLSLETQKIDGYPMTFDIDSIEQVVYLCIGDIKPPVHERAIAMPSVAGVVSNPPAGVHYTSNGDFKFTLTFANGQPLRVKTSRIIDGVQEVLTGTLNANGEYEYIIRQVKTQPIYIYIGPESEMGGENANETVNGSKVWATGNTLYIRVAKEDIASIYSIVGKLVRKIDLAEGQVGVPMESGVYVVTLKDGSVHKVIIQ
jgi:hypothetical protein